MKIELFGEIVSDDWGWIYDFFGIQNFTPQKLRDGIAAMAEGEDLDLYINSPGGDVFAGFEMYGILKECRAMTTAYVTVMACSAATTVMCGCDRALASPLSQIMIHQPAAYVDDYLNNEGAQQLKNFLDSIRASIVNGYQLKCGDKVTRHKLEELVDDSTWMPAQDAVRIGLIDGIFDYEDGSEIGEQLQAGYVIRNGVPGANVPRALLARYEAAVRAGDAQEVPGHPVTPEAPKNANLAAAEAAAVPAASALAVPELSETEREDIEICERLVEDWRLIAALDLERERGRIL